MYSRIFVTPVINAWDRHPYVSKWPEMREVRAPSNLRELWISSSLNQLLLHVDSTTRTALAGHWLTTLGVPVSLVTLLAIITITIRACLGGIMRLMLLGFVIAAALSAQVDTGNIVGSVRDASGASVPGAKVTIKESNTGLTVSTTSDQSGTYASGPLHVGTYAVRVEASGFRPEEKANLVLQVQDRLRVDFEMQVGNITEIVQVEAETPLVQAETSSLGQVIASQQITSLPLNGRDYLQLATLTTGVVKTGGGTNGNIGGSSSVGSDSFVANGARGTLNNYILDGVDNNSNDNGGAILRTNIDAIQEFKIQTNSYSAEFGRSGGAVINAVIKSGSNQFHGGAFEFLRNSALDSRGYFEDRTQPKASFKQNQFGGTLGGPVVKNKLFFFGDFQGTRIISPLTFVSSVPVGGQRTGDFSGPGNGIVYDPMSYDPATNRRQPFVGNIVPASRIDRISQAYMNLYPQPNQPGLLKNNFIISPSTNDPIDQGDVRGDYNISPADQLFARFSISGRTRLQPAPLSGLANGGGSSTGFTYEDTLGLSLGHTHTFTPSTINDVRLGFNYVHIRRGIPPTGTQLPQGDLRVPGVPDNPSTNGLTLFSPSGYRRLGDPAFAPTLLSSQERQIGDTVNKIHGQHSIKLGGQVRWSQFNIFQVPDPRGAFSFNGRFTQNPAARSGTGSALADMLLGLPSTSVISSLMTLGNRQHVLSAFVQDDFKVSHKLTLNLGLRYEYTSPIVEVNDGQANFNYSTGQLVQAGKNGASRGLTDVDKLDFAPRVGFAYSPFDDSKTVLRGGYGIFYSPQEIRTAGGLQLAYNLPFYYQPTFVSDGITAVLTVPQGFPPLSPSQAQFAPVTSEDSRLHSPYYQQWNFGAQRGLPFQTALEIAYAGSKGTHLQVLTDRNQVPKPGPGDIQSRRPYPTFGPFSSIENRGNSTYHSLQIKATKRLSHGLSFLSAFTFSKALNDLPEICCAQPWPQNSYDLRAEKARADFDQRRRWVSSFDYALPLGIGRTYLTRGGVWDWLLGGWNVGGIVAFASGFPFSPQISDDPSNTGSQGLLRANRIRNGNLPVGQRSPALWFDPSAFTEPADFTFGNAGRNVLDGPGFNTADLSVRKTFSAGERIKIEFRAEAFNAFNHPNFSQPDAVVTDGPGASGVITGTSTAMRQVQFGLKISF